MVLLAVASMLSDISKETKFKPGVSNVLYAFLNGESFDYIGSSKFVYDMLESKFPPSSNDTNDITDATKIESANISEDKDSLIWPRINLPSLKFVLELGQLNTQGSELYTHVDTHFDKDDWPLVDNLIHSAERYSVNIKNSSNTQRGLPPSSIQSILKERNVTGIFLSNFDSDYINTYYHGPYDNFTLMGVYNKENGPDQPIVKKLSNGNIIGCRVIFLP